MKAIGVIPARWGSQRFAGKVLAQIDGKPMIQHVWERAKRSRLLDEVIIACDHKDVLNVSRSFGAVSVLTSKNHPSGTDRIAEAVGDIDAEIVVNIQGDEPLIHPSIIDGLVRVLQGDRSCSMATVIKNLTRTTELNDSNVVKVVVDHNGCALYFSRSPIPYNRDNRKVKYFKHLGIYAYRKEFLNVYKRLASSPLENAERLEQLRVLEAGYKIKTILTQVETIGVDTKEDLDRVEKMMKKMKRARNSRKR